MITETPRQRFERTGRWAEAGKWCNADVAVQASVVTAAGTRASGVITRWIGPAECELDNGSRGVLVETALRRKQNKP